jgi:hypothetical protein
VSSGSGERVRVTKKLPHLQIVRSCILLEEARWERGGDGFTDPIARQYGTADHRPVLFPAHQAEGDEQFDGLL